MSLKKLLSLGLVASQISFIGGLAMAANAEVTTHTPEYTLLKKISSLQGENTSNREYKASVKEELDAYNKVAPTENRPDRMRQALVDRHLMTQEQVEQLAENVEAKTAALGTSGENITPEAVENAVAEGTFQGAQLSNCVFHRDLGVFLVAGGIISLPFIAHYADTLSSFAEDWSFAGATLGIVAGGFLLAKHHKCVN